MPEDKNREGEKLTGNTGFLKSVAFSRDENFVATGSDSTITLADLSSGRVGKIVTFVTKFPVECIGFCNNDTLIFSCSDGSFNLLSRKSITKIFSADSKPLSLAWDPVNRTLFAGCLDGSLQTFKLSEGILKPNTKYIMHTSGIELMDFNSDYSLLATAGRDKTIRLYFCDEFFRNGNIAQGTVLLKNLGGRIRSMAFSPDNMLQAGLSDRMVRIWETSSEKLASGISSMLESGFSITETSQGTTNLP